MREQNQENSNVLQPTASEGPGGRELDVASKYLSDALRISFVVLKGVMIVLIILFLASGFETVGSDEQAFVLRFGKIRGVGDERLLGPGLHWVFPYPIDEIKKIPVGKKTNLAVNSFWYFQSPWELLADTPKNRIRIPPKLNPIKDGYCITRNEKRSRTAIGFESSDYNIVHCKWQLIYQIDDPERFFRNVYVEDVKPGQMYSDVIAGSVTPLLEGVVEDSVVTAMVNYTIDEAISSQDRIPKHVQRLVQEKLDEIESGIRAVSVQLTHSAWPRQVDLAFQAYISARQSSQTVESEARAYAEKTLNEAAGPVAEELYSLVKAKSVSPEAEKLLWDNVAGAGREKIAQARAYRTEVVEIAKANAEYLQTILAEYSKHPKLVLQRIYLDMVEFVFSNADEKFVVQPAENTKGSQIRVLVNRDPTIRRKSQEEKSGAGQPR